jgi:hypothetical protein
MIERGISIGDLLATAECENCSGNKWSAVHSLTRRSSATAGETELCCGI